MRTEEFIYTLRCRWRSHGLLRIAIVSRLLSRTPSHRSGILSTIISLRGWWWSHGLSMTTVTWHMLWLRRFSSLERLRCSLCARELLRVILRRLRRIVRVLALNLDYMRQLRANERTHAASPVPGRDSVCMALPEGPGLGGGRDLSSCKLGTSSGGCWFCPKVIRSGPAGVIGLDAVCGRLL